MVFELHPVFTEFSRVLPSFTGFYRVLLGFKPNGCLLFSKSKGFLLSFILFFFTEFYWVLLGFTGFYWVLLGFTDFYEIG